MRKILIIMLLMLAIGVKAQQMPSVTGVTFGWTYDRCKDVLDKRYGTLHRVMESNSLSYFNVSIAGFDFTYAEYDFANNGETRYLSFVAFCRSFDLSYEKSRNWMFDNLCELYEEKYDYRWSDVDDDGFDYNVYGYDPLDSDDGFVIIKKTKAPTNGGEMKYWVNVYYGPVYLVDRKNDI